MEDQFLKENIVFYLILFLVKKYLKAMQFQIRITDLLWKRRWIVLNARNSCCLWVIFSLYRHIFNLLWNKSDDYLYLYIRSLENSCLKTVYRYTIFIWIHCVVEKHECVFKISDVQIIFKNIFSFCVKKIMYLIFSLNIWLSKNLFIPKSCFII